MVIEFLNMCLVIQENQLYVLSWHLNLFLEIVRITQYSLLGFSFDNSIYVLIKLHISCVFILCIKFILLLCRYLPIFIPVIIRGIKDPDAIVRNAALFAIGQYAEYLQVRTIFVFILSYYCHKIN